MRLKRFLAAGLTVYSSWFMSVSLSWLVSVGRGQEIDVVGPAGQEKQGLPQGMEMDYGPFLSYTINCRPPDATNVHNLVVKGIAVRLGTAENAAVCFDTELLRYAAAWRGGFLDISKTHLASYKGSLEAILQGQLEFQLPEVAGWTTEPGYRDPRPLKSGLLPEDWGRYQGLVRNGTNIVFHYRVAGSEVHDFPQFIVSDGVKTFSRTIWLEPTRVPLRLALCEWPKPAGMAEPVTIKDSQLGIQFQTTKDQARSLAAAILGPPPGSSLEVSSNIIELRLPILPQGGLFQVLLAAGAPEMNWRPALTQIASRLKPVRDPRSVAVAGPALWPTEIATRGRRAPDSDGYVVDTLTVPEKNLWKSWLRFIALDFFSDGRAIVGTWNGDLWIVSGIDEALQNLKWKRYAAGLYEPLGIKIVQDTVYVRGRDQITRLRDLNRDGEADAYDNFNNEGFVAPNYHAFAFDLETDSHGNFYYSRTGHRADPLLPMNGCIMKVSPDGQRTEVVATGFRAPNGMSIGPNDAITTSDNQGNWVPSSRINWIKAGGFYGFIRPRAGETTPTAYEPPLCWLPMLIDNSSGGQIWAGEHWGPFSGQLLWDPLESTCRHASLSIL